MTAHAYSNGHPIIRDAQRWLYEDNRQPITAPRPCTRCGRTPVKVMVPNGRSDDAEQLVEAGIDACLADLIQALNSGGLPTHACCCGHGVEDGYITFRDQRRPPLDLKRIGAVIDCGATN